MCNSCDNLNDDLSDLFGPADAFDPFAPGIHTGPVDTTLADNQQVRMHEETCKACRGSGRFYSYTGRLVGNCFKCKGKGKMFYRTSLAQRQKAKASADARKQRNAASLAEQANEWLEANPAEAAWLRDASGRGFEFAVSLLAALFKYGHLTEKQEAAVRNATVKAQARAAERQAQKAAALADAKVVDIAKIEQAFAAAKEARLKWPKLRLAALVFSPASASGRNAGAIYVKNNDDIYLGKIQDGRFVKSRDCDAQTEALVVEVASDPHAAAVAYGHQTGICSCCGRELTNELSVSLGIGPICREKWGWA